jgi:hypothetical protein
MSTDQTQRPKFYEEQYLGAADLTAAVDYGRIQEARHALGGHTWGIAMGLQLKETPQPGGAVSVHLLPGYAWDGYGRPIVVLSPYKIPEEKFSGIKFDPSIDVGAGLKGRLIRLWLRYDELATRNPRPDFEVCEDVDQHSRIQETFRIEIGEQNGTTDLYSGITIAAKSLDDAKKALQTFDPAAPLVYDEAVPHQAFPEPTVRSRWLIPIGYVRWLPVQNKPGHFVARDDSGAGGAEKDTDKIRRVRRYIGAVAEEIEAADSVIRLRDRGKDPASSFFQSPTVDQLAAKTNELANDLVWVEGNLRVIGNAKLCAGKLDFRDQQGQNFNIPLTVQRKEDAGAGARALQVAIGPNTQNNHRFSVGPVKPDGSVDEKFAVVSSGNVGIGSTNPTQMLTFLVPEGNRLEIGKTSATLPWSPAVPVRPGAFVINQQTQGSSGAGVGADFALMRDRKKRLTLLDADTNLSSQQSGSLRFFVNYDEPTGSQEAMTITGLGRVGIGTPNPTHQFHVLAGEAVGLFESSGAQAFLRLITKEGLNNRVEITNRPGGRFSVWTQGGGDSFNVQQNGNVGIGTTAPTRKLHVHGDRIRLENNGKFVDLRADGGFVDLHSETNHLYVRSSGLGGNNNVIINPFLGDGNVGIGTETPNSKLDVNGDLNVVTAFSLFGWTSGPSDQRLKRDIATLTGALNKLSQLRGVTFYWNDSAKMGNQTGPQMGFVAQEVEKVFPEWVSVGPNGYQAVTFRGFEALTVEAIRELNTQIEDLRASLAKLETAPKRKRTTSKKETYDERSVGGKTANASRRIQRRSGDTN